MRSSPIQVGSGYYKNLAGGLNATTAIDPYGQTLVAWGENQYGQTGINSLTNLSWTQLSNGDLFSLAIRSDSTLWAWGRNNEGQLGQSDTINRNSPTQVSGSWASIAAGNSHTIGIKSDNTLWGWGTNGSGSVGDGTIISKSSPVQINTSAWSAISAGLNFSIAIKTADKSLWSWGLNTSYQLGIGVATNRSAPVQITTPAVSWLSISSGHNFHNLAIDTNNLLYGWGTQTLGQLGLGDTALRSQPTQIGTSSWTAVSAGSSHSMAIRSDGALFTWGDNSAGQLGFNVSTLAIATGQDMSMAIRDDGTLWTWGLNTSGQLGDGTVVSKSVPTAVGLLTTWSKITKPSYTTYAIKTDGSLWAWGLNSAGSIGDGTSINKSSPVQINAWYYPGVFNTQGFTTSWIAVSAGGSTTSGIQSGYATTYPNYDAYAWGNNTYGQLGTDSNSIATYPIGLKYDQYSSKQFTVISAGTQFALGIDTLGYLYGWGRNDAGQLGTTPTTFSWTNVSSSGLHTLAIRSDYRVFSWGLNSSGQLGDGTTVNRSSPVLVMASKYATAGYNIIAISAGLSNSYIIDSGGPGSTSGYLFACGDNTQGQIPFTGGNRSNPTQIGSSTKASVFFNGTSDSFTYPANAAFQFGTGNFTVECWIYLTVGGVNQAIFDTRIPDTANLGFGFYITALNNLTFGTATIDYIGGPTTLIVNTWYKIAVSRSGTTTYQMFLNGVQEGATYTTSQNFTNSTPRIGNGVNGFFNGYIADLRVVKGEGIYTGTHAVYNYASDTTTGITTGTVSLLVFQSPPFVDISSNNFVLIPTGLPRPDMYIQPWDPFTTNSYESWSQVSASKTLNYVLATKQDKTLYGWGNNVNGVLGNYSLQSLSNMVVVSPTQVSGGGSWSAISAGGGHSLGIKTDYKLYTWGLGTTGQTAQAGTTFSWTQIAVGQQHSHAIRSDGMLFAWGINTTGQLGMSDTISRSSPVQVGSSSWSQIASGSTHTVAVRSDSTLWSWGLNNAGQLGLSDVVNRSSPVQIGTVNTWTKVYAGSSQTFAINTGFSLYAWGLNTTNGALGLGDVVNRSSPVQVATPVVSWSQVASGNSFSAGIAVDGKLYTWGHNLSGQLGGAGNGSTAGSVLSRSSPSQVGADTWNYIGVGLNAMVGIKSTGTLWSWGNNSAGELGDGSTTTSLRSSPVQVGAATNWSSVNGNFAGTFYALAGSTLYAWGNNTNGVLGDLSTTLKSSMVAVTGGGTYTKAVPGSHGMAIMATTFALQAWGTGTTGELGDNTIVNKSSPIAVGTSIPTILSAPAIIGSSSWSAVSAGGSHSMAIRVGGGLFAWGSNSNGQLGTTAIAATGDPTTTNRSSPQQVGSSSWTSVNAGGSHTLANRYGDNQLFAWGFNTQGQLGYGVTTARSSPVQINAYSATTTSALNFNGTTQYLSGGTNLPMITSGQFTIEAWVNWNGTGTSPAVCGNEGWATGNNAGWYLFLNSTGTISLSASSGTFNTQPVVYTSTNTVPAGLWTHIAMTRDASNDVRTFINGVVDTTVTNITQSLNLQSGTTPIFHIGAAVRDGGIQQAFPGSISNVRIVPRVAVYTTTFTPPTSALASTQSAGTNIAAIGPAIPNNGNSVYFNGSSMYLTVVSNAAFFFGTGDFTVEFWAYSDTSSRKDWIDINNGSGYRLLIYYNGSNIAYSPANVDRITATTAGLTLGVWQHIAVVRISGSSKMYINGSQTGSTYAPDNTNFAAAQPVYIGKDSGGSTYVQGFISNLRVVKGLGVYTGAFTTPTSPLTATQSSGTNIAAITGTSTSLLTCQSTTIIDNSTANTGGVGFTITNNGTSVVSRAYSPFGTQATILAAQGAAVTTDNSINSYTLTNVATVTQSTVTPFVAPLTGTSSSAGASGSTSISSGGYLNAWGLGTSGQVGDGTATNRSNPVQVGALTSTMEYSPVPIGSDTWKSVSAGNSHAIALKSDNTVWSWGLNTAGQVGDGTAISRSSPVQVGTASSTLTDVNAYSNYFNGTSSYFTVPYNSIFDIPASSQWTFECWALTTSATNQVLAARNWSYGSGGPTWGFALGLGVKPFWGFGGTGSATYVLAESTLSGTLGQWNHYAFTRDSNNDVRIFVNGQLGVTRNDSSAMTSASGNVYIGVASNLSPASYMNGYISNLRIVKGQALYTAAFTPTTIPLSTISQSATASNVGLLTCQNTTIVDNSIANSGVGFTITNTGAVTYSLATPFSNTIASGAIFATQISAGGTHSVALSTSSNKLYTWGSNNLGQLGDGTVIARSNPTQIGIQTLWNSIYAGIEQTIATAPDKSLWMWGNNGSGQLGLNDIANRSNPTQIVSGATALLTPNKSSPVQIGTNSWSQVSSYNATSYALSTTKLLYAWGTNAVGQLGTNNTFLRSSPVQISASISYNQIAAGGTHLTLISYSSPQSILATGLGTSGQLGDQTVVTKSYPVSTVASAYAFNSPVQVAVPTGDYSSYYNSSPVQVGSSSWTAVSAGATHTIGIKYDNTLWSWGKNTNGQLADSTTINRSSPVQVGISSWSQVSAGDSHNLILDSNGLLSAFGYNNSGQLGDNS